jgi:hypothetical protein
MLRLGPGHWAEAERHYQEAFALAQTLGSRSTVATALLGLGELAARRGEAETATRHLERARDAFAALGFNRLQLRADRLLAELAAAAKRLA